MHCLTIWDEWARTSTPPREKTPHPDHLGPQGASDKIVERDKVLLSRFVDKPVYDDSYYRIERIDRIEVPYEEPDEPIDLEAIMTRRWLRSDKYRWAQAFSTFRVARRTTYVDAMTSLFGYDQIDQPALSNPDEILDDEFDDVLTIASSMRDNQQSSDSSCDVCGAQLLDEKASMCSYCRQADLEDERVMPFESDGFEALSGHTDTSRGGAGFDSVFTFEDEHDGGIRNLSEDEYFHRMERLEREAAIEDFQNAALELNPEDGDALQNYINSLKEHMPNISLITDDD